jgi:hypothetical protein
VAASLREIAALVFCGLLAAGCAKGSGEGSAVGRVWAPDCGLDGADYTLNPDYFAMQPSTSVEIIDIVVQRGSDLPSFSDGLAVFIREPELLKETMLGTEIELGGLAAPVEMTLYLNASCPGAARIPVYYAAVSGTIRFDQLYVPWLSNETKETVAIFSNVELVDRQDPLERRAVLDGDFSFLYEVGRPLQFF